MFYTGNYPWQSRQDKFGVDHLALVRPPATHPQQRSHTQLQCFFHYSNTVNCIMVNICPSPMAVHYCKAVLYMRPYFMSFLNNLVIAVVCPQGDSGHL